MKNYSFVCFSLNISRQETERQNILNRTTADIPYSLHARLNHHRNTYFQTQRHKLYTGD